MDGWVGGWMVGWMDGCMGGGMDGWVGKERRARIERCTSENVDGCGWY